MNIEVRKTKDGSDTLYIPEMDEHYHSPWGALSESLHVFIEHGLNHLEGDISILEVGLGTGLNAILTANEALKQKRKITYYALEPHPVSELIGQFQYGDIDESSYLQNIYNDTWNQEYQINEYFTFKKIDKKLLDLDSEIKFDLIYYDAFAPNKQPEMWDKEAMKKTVEQMKDGASLVTYCAASAFKRHLKDLGCKIEKLPGANGKREMTRAFLIKS